MCGGCILSHDEEGGSVVTKCFPRFFGIVVHFDDGTTFNHHDTQTTHNNSSSAAAAVAACGCQQRTDSVCAAWHFAKLHAVRVCYSSCYHYYITHATTADCWMETTHAITHATATTAAVVAG